MIVTRSASRKFLQVTAMMSTTFSCARHCFYEPNQRKVAICICILLESVIFDFWGHFRLVVTLLRRFSLIECHERRGGENQRRGPESDSDDMVARGHIYYSRHYIILIISVHYHLFGLGGLLKFDAHCCVLVRMRDALATSYTFPLLDPLCSMCDLKHSCARNVWMSSLDCRHDFGEVRSSELVPRSQCGRQVLVSNVFVRTHPV